MDPFKLDIAIAAAVRARRRRSSVPPRQRGPQPPGHDGRGRHRLSSLAFRRRDRPARGGRSSRSPTVLQAFLRRLPDEELTTPFVGDPAAALLDRPLLPTERSLAQPWRSLVGSLVLISACEVGLRRLRATFLWLVLLFGLPVVAGPRAARAARCSRRELREKAERAERDRVERSRAGRSRRSACASPASSRSSWRTASARWSSRPRPCRAPSTAGDTRARRRGARGGRDDRPRGARRDAHAARRPAPRGRRRSTLAPQPGLARLEALVERNRERGLDVSLGWRAGGASCRRGST